ncbi:MAG: ArsR family transcriptional regulator [Candidatus Aenigmarchaeota archaeon]|nr:ArsR family transcriptional regulator [Candidatus Aenigmarchaeota archaeon]
MQRQTHKTVRYETRNKILQSLEKNSKIKYELAAELKLPVNTIASQIFKLRRMEREGLIKRIKYGPRDPHLWLALTI